MLLYRVDCSDCGAPRVGRKVPPDDKVVPFLEECDLCGSADYTIPAEE